MQAIAYAQKHLASHREGRKTEVDQVCALLCYNKDTEIQPYKVKPNISTLLSGSADI